MNNESTSSVSRIPTLPERAVSGSGRRRAARPNDIPISRSAFKVARHARLRSQADDITLLSPARLCFCTSQARPARNDPGQHSIVAEGLESCPQPLPYGLDRRPLVTNGLSPLHGQGYVI